MLNFPPDQEQTQNSQHHVHTHESEQRKHAIAGRYRFRVAVLRAHQSVNEPGLAAKFGGQPSGGVRDVRERCGEHENPEHPTRGIKFAAPKQQQRNHHFRDEQRSESDHDVVAVIEQRDIVRPVFLGKRVEAANLRAPAAVGQHAQHAGDLERIVDFALHFIGLAHQKQRRSRLAVEQAFHGRQSHRLIVGNQFALLIARGKDLQDAEDAAGDHADLDKDTAILDALFREQIESADGRHDESARDGRSAHVVRVLPERPAIQHEIPETGELQTAIRCLVVADRVLHERVGRDNEIA